MASAHTQVGNSLSRSDPKESKPESIAQVLSPGQTPKESSPESTAQEEDDLVHRERSISKSKSIPRGRSWMMKRDPTKSLASLTQQHCPYTPPSLEHEVREAMGSVSEPRSKTAVGSARLKQRRAAAPSW